MSELLWCSIGLLAVATVTIFNEESLQSIVWSYVFGACSLVGLTLLTLAVVVR